MFTNLRSARFRPSRRTTILTAAGLVAGVLPALILAAAPSANAQIPSGIGFTQEGCDNPADFVIATVTCSATGDYTTGNLGKDWAELDLVPLRVTVSASNSAAASSTFNFVVAVDNTNAGHTGYDVLSVPVLNTSPSLSAASCSAVTPGPQLTFGGQLLQQITVTVAQSTNCVYDYYARLAIGAHSFPGSSLHANLADDLTGSTSGIGTKAVSINPKELAPQALNKDMSATQDSDHQWNVTKSPSPASLDFANTCDPLNSPLSQSVDITVSWTKQAAQPSGVINVITHVYATNPAARPIFVNVSDDIRSGTTVLETVSSGNVSVPANTNQLVLTHTTTVPAGTANLNDVATGSYTDPITLVAIPGTTQASASATVQPSGVDLNSSATITDVETISGTGLSFSVDSVTGASGSFDGGYTAGTISSGAVSWTSDSQNASGSVTFHKTVYATAATVITGSLDDTATLNGSDGFTTSADGTVDISTSASSTLNIAKTTSLDIATQQAFTFHLFNGSTSTGDTVTATMPALGNGPVTSTSVVGLAPGTYHFHEDATAPYAAKDTGSATFSVTGGVLNACSATINVSNQSLPATAQVRKATLPNTLTGNWTFTLTGPNALSETLVNVPANGGYVPFTSNLDVDGGTYTITETPQSGLDLTNIVGDVHGNAGRVTTSQGSLSCSFVLNLATDSGQVFECTFTNTQRGTIIVKKLTNPANAAGTFTFTGDAAGSIGSGGTITVSNLIPGTYTSTETNPAPGFDLTGLSCNDSSSTTPSTTSLATRTATFKLDPGETVTCTFTNTQRGTIIVKKLTDPANAPGSFAFTGTAAGSIGAGGTITVPNLVPGTYTSTETNPTPAFDLTGLSCDDGSSATPSTMSVATRTATFKLDPGETVTCTFTNTQRGHATVVKTVNNGPIPAGQSFTFELRQGASAAAAGTLLETGIANSVNGTISFSATLVPGTTYQLCEQMQPGWMTTLGPPFFSVYNPSGDNSVVCTDFTVTAGQTKTFNINNSPPPGGLGLTIGYWKNWASCSGGKQAPSLDKALLAAANSGSPITEGLLALNPNVLGAATACKYAVNLLNKTTIDGKKKMASDPLFNMTAQLIAADLNVAAGAGNCAASVSAINLAHALLLTYKFDGLGYSPKLTAADAASANNLNNLLDKYNNNKLC